MFYRWRLETCQVSESRPGAPGKLEIRNTKWRIGRALAGQWVQVLEVDQRLQVYYCNTLIRELEPSIHRATIVARWIPQQNL